MFFDPPTNPKQPQTPPQNNKQLRTLTKGAPLKEALTVLALNSQDVKCAVPTEVIDERQKDWLVCRRDHLRAEAVWAGPWEPPLL